MERKRGSEREKGEKDGRQRKKINKGKWKERKKKENRERKRKRVEQRLSGPAFEVSLRLSWSDTWRPSLRGQAAAARLQCLTSAGSHHGIARVS